MGHVINDSIDLNELLTQIEVLKLQCTDDGFSVTQVAGLGESLNNAIYLFRASAIADIQKCLDACCHSLLIVGQGVDVEALSVNTNCVVSTSNPRLSFFKVLQYILSSYGLRHRGQTHIHETAKVSPQAFIEEGVSIGAYTVVEPFVVIKRDAVIGEHCVLKSGAVIGGDGFGYERCGESYLKIPHVGSVLIGDRVHIGSNTCIDSGVLSPTVIDADVKIDNLVHIAHNCHIKRGALIIACAEVSGSVTVEPYAWVAPNCSIRQKLSIGENALVGLGSVVVRNVEPNTTVIGSPAKNISKVAKV